MLSKMVPKLRTILVCIAILLNLCQWAKSEIFTAIVQVEPLLDTHKRIIDDLDFYMEQEEARLSTLKKHLNQYKREHEKAMEDIPNYLGNPINAFTLIKRLTTDLDLIEQRIGKGTDYLKNITMNHSDVKYPTLEDLTGAAQALTRLKDTYLLDVNELSEGMLNGVQHSTPMSADECFELGKALYNEKDFDNSLLWMAEALRKYQAADDKTVYVFNEADIMEYIGFAHYLLGDVKTALEWTYRLLSVDPKHVRALGNVPLYTKTIEEQEEKLRREKRDVSGEPLQAEVIPDEEEDSEADDGQWKWSYKKDRKIYEALCRGEMEIPREISDKLKCWYSTENHAFLKYAPIKTEQMYISPDLFLFHEVLGDDEIEFIKSMAMPRFARASVRDSDSGQPLVTKFRISKSSWLKDSESPKIARISQRVADMTGLSMISAEELQVANYGIGGHYDPHFDFVTNNELAYNDGLPGNRIATVLFYMSDVAQGGATVFTELGLSLFPVKRAAAFWLNLHPSGEGDMATRHAACPVLRGSKWAANKWIRQGGQELRRPCDLEFQPEGYGSKQMYIRNTKRTIFRTKTL